MNILSLKPAAYNSATKPNLRTAFEGNLQYCRSWRERRPCLCKRRMSVRSWYSVNFVAQNVWVFAVCCVYISRLLTLAYVLTSSARKFGMAKETVRLKQPKAFKRHLNSLTANCRTFSVIDGLTAYRLAREHSRRNVSASEPFHKVYKSMKLSL